MGTASTILAAVAIACATTALAFWRAARTARRHAGRLRAQVESAAGELPVLRLELARARCIATHLRESEDFSRALFAAAHAGLLVVNLDTGQIVEANPAIEAITGRRPGDIVGTVGCGFLDPVMVSMGTHPDRAGSGAVPSSTIELFNTRGEMRTCLCKATRLGSGEGSLVVISLLDITAQKTVEADLRDSWDRLNDAHVQLKLHQDRIVRSEKLASIGRLAAGVAHEINNPISYVASNLATVREYIDVMRSLLEMYARLAADPGDLPLASAIDALREEEDLPFILQDLDGLLGESSEGIARIADIVKSLKSSAREDSIKTEEHDLNGIVESTIHLIWSELKHKCTVERDLGELPPVPCSRGRISQVVMNMLVNAAQALPESGGTIRVGTKTEDGHAVIIISDDGCGMAPGAAERIFDPFYTTKDAHEAPGLGLSISHGIVAEHGGHIEVASEPGKGTTFSVHLPLAAVTAGHEIG